jgi:hypothetical protein
VQNGSEFFKGKCYDPAHPSPKKPQLTSNPGRTSEQGGPGSSAVTTDGALHERSSRASERFKHASGIQVSLTVKNDRAHGFFCIILTTYGSGVVGEDFAAPPEQCAAARRSTL